MSRYAKPRPSPAAVAASLHAQAPPSIRDAIRLDLQVAHRLGRPDLYSMVTTPSVRMERQRAEINRQGLADQRFRQGETWAQAFARWHGEEL